MGKIESMDEGIKDMYWEIWALCKQVEQPLRHRYRSLRELFERIARERMQSVSLQATDLAARINYLSAQFALEPWEKNALHTFRLTSNDVMNRRKEPVEREFLRDVRSVAEAFHKMTGVPVPKETGATPSGKAADIPGGKNENHTCPPYPCLL